MTSLQLIVFYCDYIKKEDKDADQNIKVSLLHALKMTKGLTPHDGNFIGFEKDGVTLQFIWNINDEDKHFAVDIPQMDEGAYYHKKLTIKEACDGITTFYETDTPVLEIFGGLERTEF